MFLEDPVDLLLLTPHHVPVVIVCLFPFSTIEALQYTVPKCGFKLDIRAITNNRLIRMDGIVFLFDVFAKVLGH